MGRFKHYDGPNVINLDALMVRDVVGETDDFDRDPTGGSSHDAIIFSIEQLANPADPDGFYATGSELFVLEGSTAVSFLTHGGHAWDHAYSLATFGLMMDPQNLAVLDINAIEAITQSVVPEPGCWLLAALSLVGFGRRFRT